MLFAGTMELKQISRRRTKAQRMWFMQKMEKRR
jgi:hypothetical protein